MNRKIERSYPYLIALAVGALLWHFNITVVEEKLSDLLTSAISISAILLGFLGTAKAMLLSFSSKKFKWLRSHPTLWPILLGYLKSAFNSSFVVCIVSIASLVIEPSKLWEEVATLYLPCFVGLFCLAIVTFYRVVNIIFVILADDAL